MSRFILPGLMFFIFILEGTLFQLVITERFASEIMIVPRFLIVMLVFIGIYLGRWSGALYGLIFGLLFDVVYTDLIGVYMFGFALLGYGFALTYKWLQYSNLTQVTLAFLAVFLFEYYQYGLLQIIGLTEMDHTMFFQHRLLPTLALNGAFAILMVLPMRKLLQYVLKMARFREK
ncbi:rod shape-determining protein MreD [Halalkalibacterium halodurans]|uniref:Cell shape-determining protein n=1 Tax=Halalkalibacterium halodurans TaxID=86665 RepID=A0A0M0KHZ1_ALKHA|nr:rod shape-determining protein MreD [Halalkalibacterium halodurans]MED3646594.1 rod shape-determining protein MreD [Halalkalibacterium halodurans]MED4162824.1 rod shape-determining protein MreD [Halalkalibacterium halodurans]TES48960.1 rod shape-determining protein MreD [Halalkalibacterium halodurans]TPE68304.1 rod shape-determining protein MreD [Halalkalibacterium halodurans]